MADEKINMGFVGSSSKEEVALKLLDRILNIPEERKDISREKVLDTYAQCLAAVQGNRKLNRK